MEANAWAAYGAKGRLRPLRSAGQIPQKPYPLPLAVAVETDRPEVHRPCSPARTDLHLIRVLRPSPIQPLQPYAMVPYRHMSVGFFCIDAMRALIKLHDMYHMAAKGQDSKQLEIKGECLSSLPSQTLICAMNRRERRIRLGDELQGLEFPQLPEHLLRRSGED